MVDRISYEFNGQTYSGLDAFMYRCSLDEYGNISEEVGICNNGMVKIPGYMKENIFSLLNGIGYNQSGNVLNMLDFNLASPDANGDI